MKKFLCKMALLALFVLVYFFVEPITNILNAEINTVAITNFLAENLYKNDESVASVDLVVKDYVLDGECLYIFPLGQEVSLPIDMMIVEVFDGGVEVVNLDSRFRISHIKNRKKNLYQYVHGLNSFATTDDFFLVEGDNLSMISKRLQIHYEKV